jgi:hypothetical protein
MKLALAALTGIAVAALATFLMSVGLAWKPTDKSPVTIEVTVRVDWRGSLLHPRFADAVAKLLFRRNP